MSSWELEEELNGFHKFSASSPTELRVIRKEELLLEFSSKF